MAKSVIKYKVRISFVDDSYWDDGSRWTSETYRFEKRQKAIDFANDCIAKGILIDGQNGEVNVRPEKRDITITRESSTEIPF